METKQAWIWPALWKKEEPKRCWFRGLFTCPQNRPLHGTLLVPKHDYEGVPRCKKSHFPRRSLWVTFLVPLFCECGPPTWVICAKWFLKYSLKLIPEIAHPNFLLKGGKLLASFFHWIDYMFYIQNTYWNIAQYNYYFWMVSHKKCMISCQ